MYINNLNNQFQKTGKEFKQALEKKINELQMRLSKRNEILDTLLNDKKRLRSYLLKSAAPTKVNTTRGALSTNISYGLEHIGIEEVEEIKHLCSRVFQIENEIKAYNTLRNNLKDEDIVNLSLHELLLYGFE